MNNGTHIGIWMDHHSANLVYLDKTGNYIIDKMDSPVEKHNRFTGETDNKTNWGGHSSPNEYSKNRKEESETHEYFKILKAALQKYDEILIFGPTTAGDEFFNVLVEDKQFSGKHIERAKSDKMTDNQLKAFVKEFFTPKKVK